MDFLKILYFALFTKYLIKYANYLKINELYYWQRTERNALAEVDYVISRKGKIYPIEVKTNKSGSMQSMYTMAHRILRLLQIFAGVLEFCGEFDN